MTPTPEMIERAMRAAEAEYNRIQTAGGTVFDVRVFRAAIIAAAPDETAGSLQSPLAETPSVPSKPGEWQAIFDRFDITAKSWGWQSDRGSRETADKAEAEYRTARIAMLECLASLERERDEARRERDNPAYTTEDYRRLHRAHCATEDARRKAVEERDAFANGSGWVVANAEEDRFRAWDEYGPAWTDNQDLALRFARREDAESFCRNDEDAWKILRIGTDASAVTAPPANRASDDERDAFEDWARRDHRSVEPEELEARESRNNHFYRHDCDNEAYIGWCARGASTASAREAGALELPAEMTPTIREALSYMNFQTGPIAHALRVGGAKIDIKCEAEQAHVLFWFLRLAIEHGEKWKQRVVDRFAEIADAAKSATISALDPKGDRP